MIDLEIMAGLIEKEVVMTWNAIGTDVLDAMAEAEMELDRETAMEQVIDANRLATFGGPGGKAADELVGIAIASNGYATVLTFLANRIRLV